MSSSVYETVIPHPSYLIKSISEQGYRLETALADLIDNSIAAAADTVELLISLDDEPFTLFIADNGGGMSEKILKESMRFPSSSPDSDREISDLGRFGLGLKTASFSQTRRFSVISREKGSSRFNARTWDVAALETGEWRLIVNSRAEIDAMVERYRTLSVNYLSSIKSFEPNTIVVWHGLRKFEEFLKESNRKTALKREITQITSDHLSMVFHKYLEDPNKPLCIRLNNDLLEPFSPFPENRRGLRRVEDRTARFNNDLIRLEGYVLPSSAIDESKALPNVWTSRNKSLTDMEGIYFYRQKRLISYGGWNGVIRKAQKLQLARLKVDLGNKADHLLHLNVAKSQVTIPHDLHEGFLSYVTHLSQEALKEFHNRGTRKFTGEKNSQEHLFNRRATNKGTILEVNSSFPLLSKLRASLDHSQQAQLNLLLQIVQTNINKTRQIHEDRNYLEVESNVSVEDLERSLEELLHAGISVDHIKRKLLPELGFSMESLPSEVLRVLEDTT